MLRLTAALLGALCLIGSAVGFGGRLIADRQTKQNSKWRLAAPRNQNRSRLGGGDFQAEPLGDAFVVKTGSVVLCLSVRSEVLKTRPSSLGKETFEASGGSVPKCMREKSRLR